MRVPIVRPDLGTEEAEAAARVVRSGWVLQGPEVAALETEFAAAVGAANAVAVSSGTAALTLTLRALGVRPGDEVVTVSHSFIATANSIATLGARPVFVDVERDTFGLDPQRLEASLTPRTRAVLCVHQIGLPCDIEAIGDIARRHGLPVIEDAACALGSEVCIAGVWQRIGRPHGVAACFSFHPRKIVTTGDGGMVTTHDGALADRLRLLRNHAMTVSPEARDKDPFAREAFTEPAYNFRLTDLQAAIARPQLRRLDASLAERRRLAAGYTAALAHHPVLAAPVVRDNALPNWQSYPAIIRSSLTGAGDATVREQDDLLRWFDARGISTRRGLTNAHQEPAYAGRDNFAAGPLPVSEILRRTTVFLPLFHGMTREEEATVLAALRELS